MTTSLDFLISVVSCLDEGDVLCTYADGGDLMYALRDN